MSHLEIFKCHILKRFNQVVIDLDLLRINKTQKLTILKSNNMINSKNCLTVQNQ